MNLRSVVVSLSFLISIWPAGVEAAQNYRYVRWVGLERLTIEEPVEGRASQGRIVVANDAFFETEFCEEESQYYCFFSAQHAFAVPKVVSSDTEGWTVRGVRFELVERGVSVSVFGRQVDDVLVIRSPADATAAGNEMPWLYLYSPHEGLIAFGSEDLRVTYWLAGQVGFGGSDSK